MGRMIGKRFSFGIAFLSAALFGVAGLHGQSAQPAAASPQLVLLDTDIGDDIDDAFALALILRSPELHLLGVTTAFGDTELRAQLVDRYLGAVGRTDIPVMAGVQTDAPNHFTQADYAHGGPSGKHGDGVDFMLKQIQAHPGEITLIAIGPLFNVQAAIQRDAATFRKLKRVVIMGGSVYRGYDGAGGVQRPPDPEWNIKCDPAGLQALLGVGVPVFMMPLDSTQVHLGLPRLLPVVSLGSPLTTQLTMLYHQWAEGREWPSPTLFDPVAVTYTFRPDLCPATPLRIEVDAKGNTKPVPGAPNAQVCLKVDEKGFLDLLMGRILH